ncbi:MAG TPA: hypothetical protein VGE33_08885 [Thermomonas sp.]
MSQFPREPLDADERAIAAQLPRLHGRTAPDAAMDARILAAAHAAAQAEPIGTPRRHERWVVPLGLAASLCVALGLAWRLQLESPPGTPPAPPIAGAPPAAPRPATSAPPSATPPAPAPGMPASVAAKRTTTATPAAPAIPTTDAPRADAGVLAEMARPTAIPETPAMPAAEAAMAPPPPPPPAPMAAPAPQAMAEPAPMPRAAAARAPEVLQRMAPPPPADDAPVEDVPPATADAPAVREAWLRRIGELARQGQRDAARASLEEFRRRYPDATVPPALRELLPPAPGNPGQ